MADNPTPAKCPKCGRKLPRHSPAGVCPTCLLAAGLSAESRAATQSGPLQSSPGRGFVPPTPEELTPLFPQLEILELIGRGGMGAVYKARQRGLDRLVAVKILPPEVSADPAFAERFVREARALAKLAHPHIVTVFDFGQTGELFYFVMEYVEGANLRHLLETGGLPPAEALAIVPQICEALQFAHNAGIVHRDIKPENILVSIQGQVKIADFGLAKLLSQVPTEQPLTGTHQVMGTMHYMAPEQVHRSQNVDHRADIYSLGVVFYEMLTGQLPIGRFELPSKKARTDERLDEVVLRSLESEPNRRYQHVSEVKTDLDMIALGKPPGKPPRMVTSAAPRYSRKAIAGAVWAPLFFIAVFLTVFTTSVERSPEIVGLTEQSATLTATDFDVTDADTQFAADAASPTYTGLANIQTVAIARAYSVGPALWQWILILTVLPLGVTAPFGTTVLGVISISDIRHSRGQLLGLPLAVIDALFFPLLLLDGLIMTAIGTGAGIVIAAILHFLSPSGTPAHEGLIAISLLLGLPVCVLADVLIVRAVWRQTSKPIA